MAIEKWLSTKSRRQKKVEKWKKWTDQSDFQLVDEKKRPKSTGSGRTWGRRRWRAGAWFRLGRTAILWRAALWLSGQWPELAPAPSSFVSSPAKRKIVNENSAKKTLEWSGRRLQRRLVQRPVQRWYKDAINLYGSRIRSRPKHLTEFDKKVKRHPSTSGWRFSFKTPKREAASTWPLTVAMATASVFPRTLIGRPDPMTSFRFNQRAHQRWAFGRRDRVVGSRCSGLSLVSSPPEKHNVALLSTLLMV